MFLHVCVILFTGGVSRQAPPGADTSPGTRQTPPDQAETHPPTPGPGRHPLGPGRPPGSRHPPPQSRPPQDQADPPQEEDCSIRSMSGRYASYWNAFLSDKFFTARKPVCLLFYSQGGGGVCPIACWDTPPKQTPPVGRHTPHRILRDTVSTSGRYASYWNAYLFLDKS